MKLNLLLSCGAISMLSACGGSSSGGVSNSDGGPSVVTLGQLIDRAEAFENAIGTTNIDQLGEPTAFASLPASGTANYIGVAVVGLIQDNGEGVDIATFGAVGSTTILANFGNQTVTGTADNFFQIDNPNVEGFDGLTGERISGSLAYNLSGFGQNEYIGRFTGSLTPEGQSALNVDVGGSGAFVGDQGEGFAAEAFEDGNEAFVGILAIKD
ncbi:MULTISPECIES: hypothetical protein [unclassified Yoonia]|uniref:hypothetical protein n=1 Tax=unclassified Yoonia TaxID=2629118 RepID=UPI002AFE40F3|nr:MULTISPECIES: hypothetical protein [unclassified Yoonia]